MRFIALFVVAVALAAPAARAEDPPAAPPPVRRKPIEPRKFEAGKVVDPYWGATYSCPGLEEKKGELQLGKLVDGKSGRVQIEIGIWEFPDALTAKERRDAEKRKWEAKPRAMSSTDVGDDPAPWITFEEPAPAGGVRRHGYAWYVRGPRAFVVHAYVMADAEGGAEQVKAALSGLVLGPETGASVKVQSFSRAKQMPLDDPGVLRDAAAQYLNEMPSRPAIAEELLLRMQESLPGSPLERSAPEVLEATTNLGTAQLLLKKYDAAIATFEKCLVLATKTMAPGPDGANVEYNLACAYSLAGRLDDAFAMLGKAFAKWPPVPDEHLLKDPDLESCRKDPRWAKFMETKLSKK